MKTKKLTPRNSAPVQRENAATVSRIKAAIAPQWAGPRYASDTFAYTLPYGLQRYQNFPFAGDDAE